MKNNLIVLCSFIVMSMTHKNNQSTLLTDLNCKNIIDTIPTICNIIPSEDMKYLNPFTNILTSIFPDPNNHETYSGCHYQFYTPEENAKGQIAIRLIKWGSRKEASDDFRNFFESEWSAWGIAPERLYGIADSAYFSYNADDTTKCDECGLVATIKDFGIYIGFKGEYEKITRARKKEAALYMLQMMYDRIPGLAPSRIRNLNNR